MRVYDGDTLTLADDTRVRVWGIDAPERRQACTDADGGSYPCGERAQQALEAMGLGRIAVCDVKDIDRYDRTVTVCRLDGQDLGEAMVTAGYALDYKEYSGGAYASAERAARRAERGMWSGWFQPPAELRRERR